MYHMSEYGAFYDGMQFTYSFTICHSKKIIGATTGIMTIVEKTTDKKIMDAIIRTILTRMIHPGGIKIIDNLIGLVNTTMT